MIYQTAQLLTLFLILEINCKVIDWDYFGSVNSSILTLNQEVHWSAGSGGFGKFHYNLTKIPYSKEKIKEKLNINPYYQEKLRHELWLTGPRLITNPDYTCPKQHICKIKVIYKSNSWKTTKKEIHESLIKEYLSVNKHKYLKMGHHFEGPGQNVFLFGDSKTIKVYFNEIKWHVFGRYIKLSGIGRGTSSKLVDVDTKVQILVDRNIPEGFFVFNLE